MAEGYRIAPLDCTPAGVAPQWQLGTDIVDDSFSTGGSRNLTNALITERA